MAQTSKPAAVKPTTPAAAGAVQEDWGGEAASEIVSSSEEAQPEGAVVPGGPAESGLAPQASAPATETATAPETATPKATENPQSVFPAGLNESFELLRKAEAEPVKSKADAKLKEEYLRKLREHIFNLQQGVRHHHIGANELAKAPGLKNVAAERIRLRARNDRDIADLLKANEALKKENTELKAKLSKLKTK